MKYINEFLELNSKEDDDVEKMLFLSIAVLSEVILDKKYFANNKDLKFFTNEVLEQDYKEYLFDSRPALYARIIRDLRTSKAKDLGNFKKIEEMIQEFIASYPKVEDRTSVDNNENSKRLTSKKTKTNPKVISDWRSVIESEE
ncbi:hypothetical protein [Paenibacillus dendritiformis]|uniref:hypothetical protein n=1 Tax=Paenibacillus dendritiformis TaxID=130049 RepID=UPI00387E0EC1